MHHSKINTCIKTLGEVRRSRREDWQKVICFVSYGDADNHKKIVEDSFQYYIRLDLDHMKKNHSDHFLAPHNVARAILLYHYFRDRHYFFNDEHWDYVGLKELPIFEPSAEGKDFKLWVLEQPIPSNIKNSEVTQSVNWAG